MDLVNVRVASRSRVKGTLRLALYLGFVAACSVAWLAHSAQAEIGERALALGRELERAPRRLAGTTTLRVNGQELSLNSSILSHDVDEVIDRFLAVCAKASAGIHRDLSEALRQGAKLPDSEDFGAFRTDRGKRDASAACVARGDRGMRALLDDLGRAIESGDLGLVGQYRYVYAQPASDGRGTHVLSIWSHGALRVDQMFPDAGDVPGSELVEGARPPGATRVVAAEGVNNTFQAVFYRTTVELEPALAGYGEALERAGYAAMFDREVLDALPVPARVYRRSDRDEIAVIAERKAGQTIITGYRLGTSGYVTLDL